MHSSSQNTHKLKQKKTKKHFTILKGRSPQTNLTNKQQQKQHMYTGLAQPTCCIDNRWTLIECVDWVVPWNVE